MGMMIDKRNDELASKGYDKQYEEQITHVSIHHVYACYIFCLQ